MFQISQRSVDQFKGTVSFAVIAQPERSAKDELVDVLLILARYLDTKGLQEMTLKMSDGRKIGARIEEDIFARYRRSDEEAAERRSPTAALPFLGQNQRLK